jgi:hypothetical protein
MDENNRRSFLVQKIQEKKCSECSEKAVFVEMKKLYCAKHYAKLKHIPLKDYEQRLTTNTDI